jgi:putative ABC transport system substrate-binding protein
MKRREFITLLGGAAAWPVAAGAQQSAMPVIGFFDWGRPLPNGRAVTAFRQGLAEAGYIEGRIVAIEYRWAEGQYERLPELAADLVQHQAAVIVATGALGTAMAAKPATSTIPIVILAGGDPCRQPVPARQQRYWDDLYYHRTRGQAARFAAGNGSPSHESRLSLGRSKVSEIRGRAEKHT